MMCNKGESNMSENIYKRSLDLHKKLKGKLSVSCRKTVDTMEDLALVYTPEWQSLVGQLKKTPNYCGM